MGSGGEKGIEEGPIAVDGVCPELVGKEKANVDDY